MGSMETAHSESRFSDSSVSRSVSALNGCPNAILLNRKVPDGKEDKRGRAGGGNFYKESRGKSF